jgi:hypothetical protein
MPIIKEYLKNDGTTGNYWVLKSFAVQENKILASFHLFVSAQAYAENRAQMRVVVYEIPLTEFSGEFDGLASLVEQKSVLAVADLLGGIFEGGGDVQAFSSFTETPPPSPPQAAAEERDLTLKETEQQPASTPTPDPTPDPTPEERPATKSWNPLSWF